MCDAGAATHGQILRMFDSQSRTGPANRSSEPTVEGRSTVAWRSHLAKRWWTTSAWIMERRMVDPNFASWNPMLRWLRGIEAFHLAAARSASDA